VNGSLVRKSHELSNSIYHTKFKIKLNQDLLEKQTIQLKDIEYRIGSIEKLSHEISDRELLDCEKFQNVLDCVQYKFLLKTSGISLL
jgi:hypothetical protein